MAVQHVYEKIKALDTKSHGCYIYLEDGTSFGLPPSAHFQYSKLVVDDKVLIDLSNWKTEKKIAYVWVFREDREVTRFGIGHNCHLEIPEKETAA